MFCPSQNLKCQDLPKFQFPGEGVFCPSQNSKCQDLANFSFRGGGEVCSVPEQGVLANLSKKFALSCHFLETFASQIVSHILRMWRLTKCLYVGYRVRCMRSRKIFL